MHGTIVEHGQEDRGKKLQNKSEKDQMYNHQDEETFEGHPTSVKEYLRNDMLKANRVQTDDKTK